MTISSINKLAVFNLLGPVILNGINFFTLPVFTNLLAPEGFGKVSIYLVWVQLISIFIGLQTNGTIATAKVHLPDTEQTQYRSSMLTLSGIVFFLIEGIFLIWKEQISSFLEFPILIVQIMIIQSFGSYIVSFFSMTLIYDKKAKENFFLTSSIAVLTSLISIFLILCNNVAETRYISRIIGMAIPYFLIGLWLFLYYILKNKVFFVKKYWFFALPLCLPLILHAMGHIVLGQTDKLMLQKLLKNENLVGIYSLGITLTHILNVIWSALNNTYVPFYYDDMKRKKEKEIKQRTANYMILYTLLTCGFLMTVPEFIRIFVGKAYLGILPAIPIMVWSMYMIFLYSFPVNFQFYHKKTVFIAIGTVCAALLNIGCNFILIPLYGVYGAAVATAIAYSMLFVFHQIIAGFIIKESYAFNIQCYAPHCFIVFGSICLYYLTLNSWFFRWITAFFIAAVLVWRVRKLKTIF